MSHAVLCPPTQHSRHEPPAPYKRPSCCVECWVVVGGGYNARVQSCPASPSSPLPHSLWCQQHSSHQYFSAEGEGEGEGERTGHTHTASSISPKLHASSMPESLHTTMKLHTAVLLHVLRDTLLLCVIHCGRCLLPAPVRARAVLKIDR